MYRREYLEYLSKALLFLFLPACQTIRDRVKFGTTKQSKLLFSTFYSRRFLLNRPIRRPTDPPDEVVFLNLASRQVHRLQVPTTQGHKVHINPIYVNQAMVLDYFGTNGCIIDMANRKVLHRFASTPNRWFKGHGVFSEDGKKIFLCEMDASRGGEGYIVVRELGALKKVDEFKSFGSSPHEIKFHKNKLIVCNTNRHLIWGGPNIAEIDARSGQKLNQWFSSGKDLATGHIEFIGNHLGAVANFERDKGGDYVSSPLLFLDFSKGQFREILPQGIGEKMIHSLSLFYDKESDTLGVTFQHGGLLAFFDGKGSLKNAINLKLDRARGIEMLRSEKEFVVSLLSGKLMFIDSESLRVSEVIDTNRLIGSQNLMYGPHLSKV